MKLSRAEFIAQFAIPFHVHCLKLWSRRGYAPPYAVGRCCFEWMAVTNGGVTLKAHEFTEVVRPAQSTSCFASRPKDNGLMQTSLPRKSTTPSTRQAQR